jgi:hypothetical protein
MTAYDDRLEKWHAKLADYPARIQVKGADVV